MRRRELFRFTPVALLAAAAWLVVNWTYGVPFWNYSWDYHVHSLSHGLNIDKAVSDAEPRFVDYFQAIHPGLPYQFASWVCYRAAAIGRGGAAERAEAILADPSLFWRLNQAATLVVLLLSWLWLWRRARPLGESLACASVLVFFSLPASYEFGLSYLGNETFALPLAICFFGLARRALTQPEPPLLAWCALGFVAGAVYLNKLNYIVWTLAAAAGLLAYCLVRRVTARRAMAYGGCLGAGFALAVLCLGGAFLGFDGVDKMLRIHFSIATHKGQFGAGEAGFISAQKIAEALRGMAAFKGFLFACASITLGMAAVAFHKGRDREWMRQQVPYAACLLGAMGLTFAAVLKHFDAHYLIPAAAILVPQLFWIGQHVSARTRRAAAAFALVLALFAFRQYLDYRRHKIEIARAWTQGAQEVRDLPLGPGEVRLWSYRAAVPEYMNSFAADLAGVRLVREIPLRQFPDDRMYNIWTGTAYGEKGSVPPNSAPWRYAVFDRQYFPAASSLPEPFRAEALAIFSRPGMWIVERDKPPPAPNSCEGCQFRFSAGWYPQESEGGDWWHWAETKGQLSLRAAEPATVSLRGEFMSMRLPNTVDVIVNGSRQMQWRAAEMLEISLPISAGETTVEFVSGEAPARPPGDPRLLGIGIKNLVVSDARTGKVFTRAF